MRNHPKLSNLTLFFISTLLLNINSYASTNSYGSLNDSNPAFNNIYGSANTNGGSQSSIVGNGNINYSNRNTVIGNNNVISARNPTSAVYSKEEVLSTATGKADSTLSARDSNLLGSNNTLSAVETNLIGFKNIVNNTASFSNTLGVHNTLNGSQSQVIGNGVTTSSNAVNSIAIGGGTVNYDSATKTHTILEGTKVNGKNAISIGYNNTISGDKTVALGSNITATGDNNVLLGNNSSENSNTVTNGIANNIVNDAQINGVSYSGFAGSKANGVVSIGSEGAERRITNVASGEIQESSTDAVNGSQLYLVANNLTNDVKAVKTQANTNQQNIDKNTEAITTNTKSIESNSNLISVNANNIASNSQITINNANNIELINNNIKNLILKYDSKIKTTNDRIDNLQFNYHKDINMLDNKIDSKIKDIKKHLRGIGASSAAMVSIPQVYLPGKSMLATGVGHYDGTSAIAIGYSRNSDNAKHTIKLNTSINTNKKSSFGAGYGYQW